MSKATKDHARKARMRSLDTIAVKNITSEDFIFWHDKLGPERRKYLVPKAQKDIGHGRGINHLPRFAAQRYTTQMIVHLINKVSDKQWEETKQQYRTLDETIQHGESAQIRTNNQALWEEHFPKIWLGVVSVYENDDLPDPVETTIPDTGDPLKDVLKNTSLADKPYEPEKQNTKTT